MLETKNDFKLHPGAILLSLNIKMDTQRAYDAPRERIELL